METVYVHADESCLGNQNRNGPRPGGAGGLVEVWRNEAWERRDYWIAEPDTTNNRMALRSAIEALRHLRRPCRVVFTSDSQYLVQGIRQWRHSWKRAGWKRKGGPILNLELWQELDREIERHQMDARWVRGHEGHPENEYADFLATRAAAEQTESDGLEASTFEGWLEEQRQKSRFMDVSEFGTPEHRFPESGQ